MSRRCSLFKVLWPMLCYKNIIKRNFCKALFFIWIWFSGCQPLVVPVYLFVLGELDSLYCLVKNCPSGKIKVSCLVLYENYVSILKLLVLPIHCLLATKGGHPCHGSGCLPPWPRASQDGKPWSQICWRTWNFQNTIQNIQVRRQLVRLANLSSVMALRRYFHYLPSCLLRHLLCHSLNQLPHHLVHAQTEHQRCQEIPNLPPFGNKNLYCYQLNQFCHYCLFCRR